MADTKQVIRDQITQEFMQDRPAQTLDDHTNLIEEEILDSLGIFLLLGFIKERFGVEIDPEDVTLENFETLDAIVQLVASKQTLPSS